MLIKNLIWDEWNIDHITRHNVRPEEVEQVCKERHLANKWKNKTYRVIGKTANGRYLTIFLGPRNNKSYYPITARDSTLREKREYKNKYYE